MVAQTVELPNIRKLFLPDPDHVIIDCDLERADAQVVAWEAEDEELKQMFREGSDIHTENAIAIFGGTQKSVKEGGSTSHRQKAKQGVHAVNYACQARTLAATLGITTKEAEDFINQWLGAHPKIAEWHDRVWKDLNQTRTVHNKFGYRCYYYDRIDIKRLQEALAWVPQSTVAIVTNMGLLEIHETLSEIDLLLQVHDSLVMQTPTHLIESLAKPILTAMSVEIPYPDPLTIPVNLAWSDTSWGDCRKTTHNGTEFFWADNGDSVTWPESSKIG